MNHRNNFQLPKCDGTTSTNYGPDFEILTLALFILRLSKNLKTFRIWINKIELSPWDDIVAEIDDQIICVQLKHNKKLNKIKLNVCLNEREKILKKLDDQDVIFVYFTTSPSDDSFRSNFTQVNELSNLLSLLVTDTQYIYVDNDTSNGNTTCCMQQHNVARLKLDLKQSLEEFIGNHLLTKDHLNLIQTKFLEYLRLRYQKLIKKDEPITNEEITTQLSFCILDKFKVEYKGSDSKITTTNNLDLILGLSTIVVVNHKPKSNFKELIWQHLITTLREVIPKRHLKQSNFDTLWIDGKLHMPIVSSDIHSDKIILRALQIGNYKPKVLILRNKIFTIKEKQHVITILQNLNKSSNELQTITRDSLEKFAYAQINLEFLFNNNNIILHKEAFVKVAKNFFNPLISCPLEQIVEAHDELNFVNNREAHALFLAIRIKNVDLRIIQHIIELGGDVNAITEDDNTPLFYAIEENRLDILNLLLENGADPNPSNKFGVKPLFVAVLNNRLQMMESLINAGASRSDCDSKGVSPLFMAYKAKHWDAMKLILKNFDRANAADVHGSHILHRAAEDNDIECLKGVIDNCLSVGAFINGDRWGKTPLDIAEEKKNDHFSQLLKSALED